MTEQMSQQHSQVHAHFAQHARWSLAWQHKGHLPSMTVERRRKVCQLYIWQCEAYCEGIDGILKAVSFTNRCADVVPQSAAWPRHVGRLFAVHWWLASRHPSVGCLSAACTVNSYQYCHLSKHSAVQSQQLSAISFVSSTQQCTVSSCHHCQVSVACSSAEWATVSTGKDVH